MGRRHTAFLKKSPMPSFDFSRKTGFIAAMRGAQGRSIGALYGLGRKKTGGEGAAALSRRGKGCAAGVCLGSSGVSGREKELASCDYGASAYGFAVGRPGACGSFRHAARTAFILPLFREEPKMREIGAQMLARRGQKDRRRRRGCALPAWEGLRGGCLIRWFWG